VLSNDKEVEIREFITENNLLEAVILCPQKMFVSTDIAVCILVLDKNKKDNYTTFVDMTKTHDTEEREQRGQFGGKSHTNRVYKKEFNIFTAEQMAKAKHCIDNRQNETMFCASVNIETIKQNNYEFSPRRYIEFKNDEFKYRELTAISADINAITKELNAVKITMNQTIAKQLGLLDIQESIVKSNQCNEIFNTECKDTKLDDISYFSLTKNRGEIKIENQNTDSLSEIFIMFLNMWQQHIAYLNNKQSVLLAELRDSYINQVFSQQN
jgi:type I restriction-modification system DNA methylase subunit